MRCIDKQIVLPGHSTQKAVPVCQPCYEKVQGSNPNSPE